MDIQIVENKSINGNYMQTSHSQVASRNIEITDSKTTTEDLYVQEKRIEKIVEDANKILKEYNEEIIYSMHEKFNQIMVKIIDKQTNEVIKEIPSEKIVDMIANMCEQAGLLIDEKR